MMKRILGLLLAMCFALTCVGGALAEQAEPAPYNPGEITSALFENLPTGTMTAADMKLTATFGDAFAELSGVDAATLAAISEVLSQTGLHVSVGEIAEGARLALDAYYGADDSMVSVGAAINITEAGLTLESDLIDGSKITVTWETLLRLLGADDDTIAALKSLASLTEEDITGILTALLEQLAVYAEKAAAVATPYLDAVAAFASGLPMEMAENVPAAGIYPAAAQAVTISCTDKALGELLITLADILEKDATLSPLLDQVIASSDTTISHNGVTATNTAEACALLRTAVSEKLTDETRPLQLVLAADENGMPVYAELSKAFEDGSAFILNAIATQPSEDQIVFFFSVGLLDAQGSYADGMTLSLTIGAGPENSGTVTVETDMTVFEDGETMMSQKQKVSTSPYEENGMVGQSLSYALTQAQEDATVDMTMTGTALPNTQSGENMDYTGTINVTADDTAIGIGLNYTLDSSMTEDGPMAILAYLLSTPDVGLDEYGMIAVSYTYQYDAAETAALQEYALESATSEDINGLISTAMQTAQEKLSALMAQLPEALIALISSAE